MGATNRAGLTVFHQTVFFFFSQKVYIFFQWNHGTHLLSAQRKSYFSLNHRIYRKEAACVLIKIEQIAGFKAEFLQKKLVNFFSSDMGSSGQGYPSPPSGRVSAGCLLPPVPHREWCRGGSVGAVACPELLAGENSRSWPRVWGAHPHPAPWERKAGSGRGHSVVNNPRWMRCSCRFPLPKRWDSLGTPIS